MSVRLFHRGMRIVFVVRRGTVLVTNAQIIQDGGLVRTTNATMTLGNGGAYHLTNGVFEGGLVELGTPSRGRFYQYGGTAVIASLQFNTFGPRACGYSLYGGTLHLPGGVSFSGAQYFQAGGTNRTPRVLMGIAYGAGAADFTLDGGLLAVGDVDIQAGYYGGIVDLVVQRIIEVIQSLPTIPLWLALAAIMPVTWGPILGHFGITLILGMLEWTSLARAVRSKLLSLREEDYVLAARLLGASPPRIIGRHLIPGFMSHLIASATLSIPAMILGETALSFLGLGLRPPITSWGVLLTEAQNINVVALYPWLMLPVVPVIIPVLAFNFLGDGLRDAADPYS